MLLVKVSCGRHCLWGYPQHREVYGVCTLLTVGGFEVHDLGINVKAEEFVEGIKKHKADILAMLSLTTMAATEQRKVIGMLAEEGLRDKVKTMVGGAAITADFAKSRGADGYAPDAPSAVELAKELVTS